MPPQRTVPCGTTTAYRRHVADGSTPCQPCRDAWAAYHRDRYHKIKEARRG